MPVQCGVNGGPGRGEHPGGPAADVRDAQGARQGAMRAQSQASASGYR